MRPAPEPLSSTIPTGIGLLGFSEQSVRVRNDFGIAAMTIRQGNASLTTCDTCYPTSIRLALVFWLMIELGALVCFLTDLHSHLVFAPSSAFGFRSAALLGPDIRISGTDVSPLLRSLAFYLHSTFPNQTLRLQPSPPDGSDAAR